MLDATIHALLHSAAVAEAVPYELPPAWRGLTKFAYFIGFTMVMGTTVVHSLVLRGALRRHAADAHSAEVLNRWSATALASAGLVFLLSLWPQLAGKVARAGDGMAFGQALRPENVWAYLMTPGSGGIPLGITVLVQFSTFAAGSLLLVALFAPAARRHIDAIAGTVAIATAAASVMLGVSGDLVARDTDGWMTRLPSYVHVLSGTTWVGGVVALALLGTARHRLRVGAGDVWAHMWKRFSFIAQACVAGIIVSGLWMVRDVVSAPSDLLLTTFGRILLLKILLVATLIGIGVFNEHVLLPRIVKMRTTGDRHGMFAVAARHFPQVVIAEAIIGASVLLVVPFLNGSAREETGAPEAHATATMFLATAALIVVLAASFAVNARFQTNAERRAGGSEAIRERLLASEHTPG